MPWQAVVAERVACMPAGPAHDLEGRKVDGLFPFVRTDGLMDRRPQRRLGTQSATMAELNSNVLPSGTGESVTTICRPALMR